MCSLFTGFIGYVLEQQLKNVLLQTDLDRDVITIITQVLVNKDDPAFNNPTKPIGPYYTKEEADRIIKESGAVLPRIHAAGGWRKVVASPKPLVINNKNHRKYCPARFDNNSCWWWWNTRLLCLRKQT